MGVSHKDMDMPWLNSEFKVKGTTAFRTKRAGKEKKIENLNTLSHTLSCNTTLAPL